MKKRISFPFLNRCGALALAVGLIFLSVGSGFGQIIPTNRTINWSPAICGVPAGLAPIYTNGVPYRTTIFTNAAAAGCDTNGVKDCTAILGSLMLACPAGQVVYMPAGRYLLTQTINVGKLSDVTLRGAGMGKTILIDGNTTTRQSLFYFGSANPEGVVKVLSGNHKGSSNIVVNAITDGSYNLYPGCMILVAQPDDTNFVHNLSPNPYWGAPNSATNNLSQCTMVTALNGTSVSIWPPLIWDFTNAPGASCQIFAPGTAFRDSVEDLTITHTNSVTGLVGKCGNSINAMQCSMCWFRNVESAFVNNYHFAGFYLNQCTIRDCYFHEAAYYGPSQGAGLLFYASCCGCLVENNICYRCSPATEINGASSGNVFTYNYSYETLDAPIATQSGEIILADFDCNHGPHNMMNLWEGNVGTAFQSDSYFGSCSHQTLFRNNFTAAHPLANQFLRAIDLGIWSDYFNIVGNVLGTPVVTNLSGQVLWGGGGVLELSVPNFSYTIPVIYRMGYPHLGNNDYTTNAFNPMPSVYTPDGAAPRDLNVDATVLEIANYDYVRHLETFPTNLPNSLYYTSQPGWWPASNSWPPIGPDLTPMVSPLPAQARFALLINASTNVPPPVNNPLPPTPQNLHVAH